jgi:hypothetical protein
MRRAISAESDEVTEDLLDYIKCNIADCAVQSDVKWLSRDGLVRLLLFMDKHLEIDLKGTIVTLVKRWTRVPASAVELSARSLTTMGSQSLPC